jgi:hypothetical protein
MLRLVDEKRWESDKIEKNLLGIWVWDGRKMKPFTQLSVIQLLRFG